MNLTIVIPVYNEEKRIKNAVDALNTHLPSFKDITVNVIFVNDGSTDQTVNVINSLDKDFNSEIISYATNQGKGYALKTGFLQAAGDYVLLMDADMSTPFEELTKFLPEIKNNTPVIIGSRKTAGANVLKHQKPWRQKLGEGFTLLSNLLLVLNISDFTCGFKVFRQDAAYKIFKTQQIKRWGYDSEIIFLAKKFGFSIKEIPVVWTNDERSRVNLFKDVFRSFWDLIQLRYNDLTGKYEG